MWNTTGKSIFDLIPAISERVHWYSTALFRIQKAGPNAGVADPISSGIFVSFDEIYGIATVDHVAKQLSRDYFLCLTLDKALECPTIDVDHIQIVEIADRVSDKYGQDLSFVRMHFPDIETIRAFKSYHSLGPDRERMLDNSPSDSKCLWCVSGVPFEWTIVEDHESGMGHVLSVKFMCWAGGATMETRGDFDYFRLDVEHGADSALLGRFNGISGGGLWQVPIAKSESGNVIATECFFAGVAFYQQVTDDAVDFIRCHGRHSVYRKMCDKVHELGDAEQI